MSHFNPGFEEMDAVSYTSSDGGIVVMGHGTIERMHVT